MLAVVLNSDSEFAQSSWGVWVETIMTKKWAFGIQQAALVRKTGTMAAATADFGTTREEILNIKGYFANLNEGEPMQLGRTYVIKSKTPLQIIGFSGANYVIISRSKTMYVVAKCRREGAAETARWIRQVNYELIKKDY